MDLPIVPRPRHAVAHTGEAFRLSPGDSLTGPDFAVGPLSDLAGGPLQPSEHDARIRVRTVEPPADARPSGPGITPSGRPSSAEWHRIVVGDRLDIEVGGPEGLAHAVATLRQLAVPSDTVGPIDTDRPVDTDGWTSRSAAHDGTVPDGGGVLLPRMEIEDAPRFGWRGLSLDVARSFFPVAEVERVIDLLASLKFNALHLHLSDDHGWRLEIHSRPRLTEISGATAEPGARSGYFTQEEFRHLVDYAARRHITVVPEIDLPGHTNSVHLAYPELHPEGRIVEPAAGLEVGYSWISVDTPGTEDFLADVLGELAALTPGPYLHIGGDEAIAMAKDDYVRTVEAAQRIVTGLGKRAVGWNEVVSAELEPDTIVEYWDSKADPTRLIEAARAGRPVILAPANRSYLDIQYGPGEPPAELASPERRQSLVDRRARGIDYPEHLVLGQDWPGYVPVRNSYQWDPVTLFDGMPASAVVGVEAGLWTETIVTFDDVTTMLLPRLLAVADVAWSPAGRDWEDFCHRVRIRSADWERDGLAFYRSPEVWS